LPLGRYGCTEEEIRATFVDDPRFAASKTRLNIWNDWETARATVNSIVTIHAAWVAGSFTTGKMDPGDIDVVFVVKGEEVDRLQPTEMSVLSLFANGSRGALHHKLQVDSYLVPWYPFVSPNFTSADPRELGYFWSRGHWDDFWLRARTGAKTDTPTREDTIPRRGYLEVSYHDYS
jgi:hypothetical protein